MEESKTIELKTALTVDELDLSTEEVEDCSSIDEVVENSIRDTWS